MMRWQRIEDAIPPVVTVSISSVDPDSPRELTNLGSVDLEPSHSPPPPPARRNNDAILET
jgi:hypothetical protein